MPHAREMHARKHPHSLVIPVLVKDGDTPTCLLSAFSAPPRPSTIGIQTLTGKEIEIDVEPEDTVRLSPQHLLLALCVEA